MSVIYEAKCECGKTLDADCVLDDGQDLVVTVEKCPDCFEMLESLDDKVQSLRKQVETRDKKIAELEDEVLRAHDI